MSVSHAQSVHESHGQCDVLLAVIESRGVICIGPLGEGTHFSSRHRRWPSDRSSRRERLAVAVAQARHAVRRHRRSDVSRTLYMVGGWRRPSMRVANQPRQCVPPRRAVGRAMVMGDSRRALLRCNDSRIHRRAVPLCIFSSCGVPSRLRFFVID